MLKQASFGLAVLSVVGFVFCTVALGQDTATKPKSFAKDYLIGNWTVEGTVLGEATEGTMRVRPAAKGTCMIYNWSLGTSEAKKVPGLAVACRDPQTGEVLEYCFESNGSQFLQRFPAEEYPDTGVRHGERTGTIQGKPYKGKITVDRKGRSEFLFTVTSEQGEDVRFTFRRVQDEQAVSPAYEHLKDLEDFVGNWVAEETLNQDMPGIGQKGDVLKYRASFKWIQDKSILQLDFVITVADGKSLSGRYLFGWDAGNKTIMHSGFDMSGGRYWADLKKDSPDKWIWENKSTGADGTPGSGTDTMMMLDNNSTHVHEYTNTLVDGKPQPDRRVVYKRVK